MGVERCQFYHQFVLFSFLSFLFFLLRLNTMACKYFKQFIYVLRVACDIHIICEGSLSTIHSVLQTLCLVRTFSIGKMGELNEFNSK